MQGTNELIAVCDLPPVLFGYATTIIPRIYTYYVSTALFAIFGVRMLREGLRMSPDEGQEELEEVQAEIKKKDEEVNQMLELMLNADTTWQRLSGAMLEKRCFSKRHPDTTLYMKSAFEFTCENDANTKRLMVPYYAHFSLPV